MKNYLFNLFLLLSFVLFLIPGKVCAASPSVVINEIMYSPLGPDDKHEWVEVLNISDKAVSLKDWKFNDGSDHIIKIPEGETDILIDPGKYLILCDDPATFLSDYTSFSGQVIDTVMSLNNTADSLSLIDDKGLTVDTVSYSNTWGANGNGKSLEKISPSDGNTFSNWQESFVKGGTPNAKTSIKPELPIPDPPSNLKVQIDGQTVVLTWEENDLQPLTFEVLISDDSGIIIDEPPQNPNELRYTTELEWGSYTWQVIAVNEVGDESMSVGPLFTLSEPIFSDEIILSEILPHPSLGANYEFIELYNKGEQTVDLSGWFLDDIANGGSSPYKIIAGTIIKSGEYLVFYKTESKISLNDNGETIFLYNPLMETISTTSYDEYASTDFAWAYENGKWQWTEKLTPGIKNKIYITPEEKTDDEEVLTINEIPIEIKTGEYKKFEEKLVAVTGTVITTSGNTFYLDDGSGSAKIYIQDKTGIEKPPMHKGDLFAVI